MRPTGRMLCPKAIPDLTACKACALPCDDRGMIDVRVKRGDSQRAIARLLQRPACTLRREIAGNAGQRGDRKHVWRGKRKGGCLWKNLRHNGKKIQHAQKSGHVHKKRRPCPQPRRCRQTCPVDCNGGGFARNLHLLPAQRWQRKTAMEGLPRMKLTIHPILAADAKGKKLSNTVAEVFACHPLRWSFAVGRLQLAGDIAHFGGWRACAGARK